MSDRASWVYGLGLIVLTMTIHTTGVVTIGLTPQRVRNWLVKTKASNWRAGVLLTCHIAVAGLALVALHGLESALWAAVYVRAGALGSLNDALLYSLSAMTTFGTSVELPYRWQVMGALEALNGIILVGMSTALIIGIVHNYWPRFGSDHVGID